MFTRATSVLRQLRHLLGPRCADDGRDAELLDRFLANQDDAAFEALLWRHGPMVLGICQRMIGHVQDAEDAFQATFVVLLRKARTVRKSASLASWLYKVAYRICVESRRKLRSRREQALEQPPASESPDPAWRELRPILDEAMMKLPEKYRRPLQLCYLDGKTCQEAAEQLRCPLGTVLTRMAKARQLLQASLRRKGLSLSVAAMAGVLGQHAAAEAAPPHLVQATMHAVSALQAGTGVVSSEVLTLAQGVIKSMFTLKLRIAAAIVVVLGLAAAGAGFYAQSGNEPAPAQYVSKDQARAQDAPAKSANSQPKPKSEPVWSERRTIDTETDSLRELRFCRDGKLLVGYSGGFIVGWDPATGKEAFTIEWNPGQNEFQIEASADGKLVAGLSPFEGVRIWNVATRKEQTRFRPPLNREDRLAACAIAPDFQRLATGDRAGIVAVWGPATGKEVWRSAEPAGAVCCLDISADGKTLASIHEIEPPRQKGAQDRRRLLRLWDMDEGRILFESDDADTIGKPWSLRYSADGKTLVVNDWGLGVRLLKPVADKEKQVTLKQNGSIKCANLFSTGISASADASWIAVAPQGGRLRVYQTGVEQPHAVLSWEASPPSVTMSPDGKTLAAVRGGRIRIWDLSGERPKE